MVSLKKSLAGGSDLGATYTEDSLLKITLSTIWLKSSPAAYILKQGTSRDELKPSGTRTGTTRN